MTYYNDIIKARRQFVLSYKKRDYPNCIIIGKKLIALYKKHDDVDSIDYANDQYNLACAYQETRNYTQAKLLYFDSIRRIKKLQGKGVAYADRLNNIAVCCARMGEVDNAIKYLKEAETVLILKGHENSPQYLSCLYNLANAHYDKGNYDDAIRLHVTVLFNTKDEGDAYTDSLNCIGYAYEKLNDLENAVNYMKRAMAHVEKLHGVQSQEYLANLYYIGQLYNRKEDYKSSIKSYENASKIIKEMFNGDNPYYGDALNRLAEVLFYDGQKEESLRVRLDALKIIKEHIGENHVYYANSLRNIALLYKDQDDDKAIEYFVESMKIKNSIVGAGNTDYIKDVMILSGMFIERYEYDKAAILLRDTIEMLQKDGGEFANIIPDIMKIFNSIKGIQRTKNTIEFKNSGLNETDIFKLLKSVEDQIEETIGFSDMDMS